MVSVPRGEQIRMCFAFSTKRRLKVIQRRSLHGRDELEQKEKKPSNEQTTGNRTFTNGNRLEKKRKLNG